MEDVSRMLASAVRELYGIEMQPEVTAAPENVAADYASNVALKLTRELHRAPMEIAEEIKGALVSTGVAEDVTVKNEDWGNGSAQFAISVTPPGFVNFNAKNEYFCTKITEMGENFDKNISWDEYLNKTVICEFSDPNPFKVLHVGHLYTSIVGDAISRLFEYAGARVVRANFGGDVGLHVAKTMYALTRNDVKIEDLTIEDIAQCYIEGTAAYENDPEAKREITKLNKEIYRINAEGKHDTLIAQLYWRGRELSYEYFDEFYARIGVKFDKYYPESSVAQLGLDKVREELEQGVYEKSDGAVIFDGEKYGLHTRVFINQEGVPTYEAKDVGLIFAKWADWHFDKSVVITGNEQLDYMKVVLCSVEQYAPELVERTAHLTHGLVKLPGNVKMSSRKGNFLKAVDVLELVSEALLNEYKSRDEKVVMAAVKYAFLKYKMGGDIIFDPGESVKMSGNSGPYLLYSCVRAKKILAKAGGADSKPNFFGTRSRALAQAYGPEKVSLESTSSESLAPQERDLMRKILEYRGVLTEAAEEMAPHKVAGYLYELAQEFSRFYEKCQVAGSEYAERRVKLVEMYLKVMEHGLGILGIEVPEEM